MEKKIKFAHLADLHLGGWREKNMTKLNFLSFQKSIQIILEKKLDFVIFAGDIFNSAIPSIEIVEAFVDELKKLKKQNIPIYVIAGSHDYSNLGKSFISLLDKTGILTDVGKFEYIDKDKIKLNYIKNDKLKLNIVGVLGKKHGLDKNIYSNISKQDLNKDYLNIFLFHTTLDNFKPSFMNNVKTEVTKEYLPVGFDYYAGGHIHSFMQSTYSNSPILYSGCLFPNNFSELKREKPGFVICEFNFDTRQISIKREILQLYKKEYINIIIDKLNPIQSYNFILEKINGIDFENKLVMLEIQGIVDGRISDININKIISQIYANSALIVLKNTYKLNTLSLENKKVNINENIEEIEDFVINDILIDSINKKNDKKLVSKILKEDFSKIDEEKNSEYEKRIINIFDNKIFSEE